jgi:ABC-type sugar transport system ATPase subunit
MGMVVKNMSFSVYAGEVVGIAGLIGSGRTEIAKIIFGALKRNLVNGGTIKLRGKPIRYRVPRQAIDDGIAYITEDRKANGFFETMIVDDNVYVGRLATRAGFSFLLSRARRSKIANYWVERLKINALQRKAKIIELSGGNQQKVVLARCLVHQPRVLLLDEPTRGIDVGAKAEVFALMAELLEQGMAIVLVSSEMLEILGLSDRVFVMHEQAIAGELSRAEATEERIAFLSAGGGRRVGAAA